MTRWLALAAALAACTPTPHDDGMPQRRPVEPPAAPVDPSLRDPLAELARSEQELAVAGGPSLAYGPPLQLYPAPAVDLGGLLASIPMMPPMPDEPSFSHGHAAWPGMCERRGRRPDDELA